MDAELQQARDEWIALRCQHGEPQAFADLVREMERPRLYFAQKLLGNEDKGAVLEVQLLEIKEQVRGCSS